jgi:hypothetical protein
MIPIMIIILIPLPIPLSVIRSPSHITNNVEQVRIMIELNIHEKLSGYAPAGILLEI